MEKNVAERICKLILKYCNDDVSDVHHIKYYCDRILKEKETQMDIDLANRG